MHRRWRCCLIFCSFVALSRCRLATTALSLHSMKRGRLPVHLPLLAKIAPAVAQGQAPPRKDDALLLRIHAFGKETTTATATRRMQRLCR